MILDFLMMFVILLVLIFLILINAKIIDLQKNDERDYPDPNGAPWIARFPDGKLINISYRYININGDQCWHFSGTERDYDLVANERDGEIVIEDGAWFGRGLFQFRKSFSGAIMDFQSDELISVSESKLLKSGELQKERAIEIYRNISVSKGLIDSAKQASDYADAEFSRNIQKTEFLRSIVDKKMGKLAKSLDQEEQVTPPEETDTEIQEGNANV